MKRVTVCAAFAGLLACSSNAPSGAANGVTTSTPTGGTTAASNSVSGTTNTPGGSSTAASTTAGASSASTTSATAGATAPDATVAGSGAPDAAADATAESASTGDEAATFDDSGAPIVDLFNGTDLTGFLVYEQTTRTTAGTLLTGAAAEAIFQPENGMIHVYGDLPGGSTQPQYTLETVGSYSHYNLWWQYQWGTKKFANETDGPASATNLVMYPRDAGLLWALSGDLAQVWPSCIEFQNKWGTTGDIFALYAQCEAYGTPGSATSLTTYEPPEAGGVETLVDGSNGYVQHHRSEDWEMMTLADGGISPDGAGTGWNSCLLQVDNGAAIYTVNGHVVNQVILAMDQSGKPVLSGPLAWEAESAEVYYRNLQIQVLP
ncbi:MAG: family 16 glycoside hydrolase [Polyangiaceae bacterium]|jgi:hypothetical protein